ncbi:type II secretion system minor pseudopilin GspI [Marilutibacter spongiae]|uniref:Type II secretion system protein I n=1 Tax=Marilutibacter spongiae TaxID=2025720 RepID=A0A7W3TM81_9GAMM|nr:type II secretion system minor pseudopilin GspI [Lysobacter spongiae]MBB1060920.1 type II secretion system minor pseudopilin GspI [Lysobacter spongiae]
MQRTADMRARGFSLIEVLVALAIFGLAVIALLNLAGESTRNTAWMRERILAGVVADNRAVEASLAGRAELDAMMAIREGVEEAGGQDWRWTRRFEATDVPGLMRVDVTVVAADSDRIAAELTLYRTSP